MKYPELNDVLRDSMAQPLLTVGHIFQLMKVKENTVGLGVTANEAQITERFQHALFVDSSLTPGDLTTNNLKRAEAYQKSSSNLSYSSQ